jgi:hypothetical protein
MFPLDALLKNAHDLTFATKLVRDTDAYEMPKAQAARPATTRRLADISVALATAAPIVVWLAWAVLS